MKELLTKIYCCITVITRVLCKHNNIFIIIDNNRITILLHHHNKSKSHSQNVDYFMQPTVTTKLESSPLLIAKLEHMVQLSCKVTCPHMSLATILCDPCENLTCCMLASILCIILKSLFIIATANYSSHD